MSDINNDFFVNGTGHIVSSSHNDIAWWNTPYKTMEYRDINIISPAIDMVMQDSNFKHNMECILYLMEYIQRHPDKKDIIYKLALEKKLMWGATYTQPYENMLNDEALVRQVYLGKKWMKKEFPGTDPRVAWSPDVPARSMQFPQVLAKAGIDYLMISRVNAGAFEWFSPDGSSVKGFSPGHYFTSAKALNTDVEKAIENVSETLTDARKHYEEYNLPPEYLFLSVADYVAPKNYRNLIEQWPSYENRRDTDIPKLKHSTVEEFMDALTSKPNTEFQKYIGERPNEWAYIHGTTHHKGVNYGRQASIIMPEAEMFLTISCLLKKSFEDYPASVIEEGWKNILYPDHGFGGGNGHITDRVFDNSMKRGYMIAKELREDAVKDICNHIKTKVFGQPVIIFNARSYIRTDVVKYRLDIRDISARYFEIVDEFNNEIDYQIVDEDNAFSLTIEFIAKDIPAIGYKTYYVKPSEESTKNIWLKETHIQRDWLAENENLDIEGKEPLKASEMTIENIFYKITFCKGGLTSIIDKELGKELIDTKNYNGFELFMMQSKGTGAGEFEAIEQPTFDFADAMKNYDTKWEKIEDGSVKTTIKLETKFSHCYVVQYITLYHSIKKIDCDIELISFDGTINKEYRIAMPLSMDKPQLAYDVPMGVVEIGKDEVDGAIASDFFKGIDVIHYPTPCSEIHPREVQNWISASDKEMTVFLSSDVSMFDYINPKQPNSKQVMIQPILLASRKSCHGWGNDYHQMGTHKFHFTFTSCKGDWRDGSKNIEGANSPLLPITPKQIKIKGSLPESYSFYSVNQPNMVISTIKKCEDDDSIILRTYENHGMDCYMNLSYFDEVKEIKLTNIIEEERGDLFNKSNISIGKRSINTFKLIY